MPSTLSSPVWSFTQILLVGLFDACRRAFGRDRPGSCDDPHRNEPSSEASERHQAVLAAMRHW